MKTRNGGVMVSQTPGSATSPVLRRSLRPRTPRQDAGVQGGASSGGEANDPHVSLSSRVTRSSASSFSSTTSTNGHRVIQSPQQQQQLITTSLPFRTPVGSHGKRAVSPGALSAGTARRRLKRTRHRSGFYNDESEGDPEEGDHGSFTTTLGVGAERTGSPRRSSARSVKRRKQTTPTRQTLRAGQLVLKPPKTATTTPEAVAESRPQEVFIPNWVSLPWFFWEQVFQDASSSLEDSHRAKWLLAASTICRALEEPAITALYRRPPLASRGMAHGLVSLLAKDPSTTLFAYRTKIRRLSIDVNEIASKLHRGEPLDFTQLLRHLPELKALELYHWKDDPVMRDMGSNLRWRYPRQLFQGLEASGARLVEWRWNRRFTEHAFDWGEIKKIHERELSSVKKVTLFNYQLPSLEATSRDDEAEVLERDNVFVKNMADAINALSQLEHVGFEYSNAVDDRILPMLPRNLRGLDLTNCCEVTDEDLASFLLTHGNRLESLTLRHNRALSLSWLTILGKACPRLKWVVMDYKIGAQIELGYRNVDATCGVLERFESAPVWPETLVGIELKDFKHWTAEAAEVFFRSLVDCAGGLSRLREIDLKVMLDVPYQQRSDFRDRWSNTLRKVFLRDDFDEDTGITSLRAAPAAAVGGEVVEPPLSVAKKTKKRGVDSPSRRSSRIREQYSNPSSRASSVGRDLRGGRVAEKKGFGFSYAEPETDGEDIMGEDDDDDMELDDEEKEEEKEEELYYRQGMCNRVEVVLDNGKPVAMPYSMNDFVDVDEGGSGEGDDDSDEDWDGGDGGEGEDEGYAW